MGKISNQKLIIKSLLPALKICAFTLIICSVLYPLIVTGFAKTLFPNKASGSMVTIHEGVVVGSELIAQQFLQPYYFHSRPSAAGVNGYDATASGGSNLSANSSTLKENRDKQIAQQKSLNPHSTTRPPQDLVTASASGLDPDISLNAALFQIERIATSRKIAASRIKNLVDSNLQKRQLGVLGEERVNVLILNVALDRTFGKPK